MNEHTRLKVWVREDWTVEDKDRLRSAMVSDLGAPWYLRVYDAPGLVGQWLGNTFGFGRSVNLPWVHYCSSRVAKHFGAWMPGLREQASPADIDRYCAAHSEWKCIGVYDPQQESDDA